MLGHCKVEPSMLSCAPVVMVMLAMAEVWGSYVVVVVVATRQ